MADLVFNIAKGKAAYYAGLPATNDALIVVPIEASGIEADETLKDYDNLSALLGGTSNEQTSNMTRKTLASVTVTVSDSPGENWVNIDAADPTWTAVTGNAIAALVICYDPDTTGGTDSDLIPLVKLDCAMTPDGSDFTAQFATTGFYRAS
ncbi:MAG: hypothetical protein RL330_1112 [Actinomycetota bacterium]|jgi:hypothetical protein